jgi:hypothetical protein
MHCPIRYFALLRVLGLLSFATATGCVDSTSLCETRLTPINVPVATAEPSGNRGTHP